MKVDIEPQCPCLVHLVLQLQIRLAEFRPDLRRGVRDAA